MNPPLDLRGWLPISIDTRTPEPTVEWCRLATQRFTDPFFDHTVQDLMRAPFNLLFRHKTSLDTLIDVQKNLRGLQPAGFIFHMSHCGSTLVSQMLAALPEHIMLSEPPPLDVILRTDRRGASDKQRIAWLQAWVHAISQPRHGETRLFIKLDAWHIFDLPLLRRAFPHTPWIFLYRNPLEVLVSAMKVPSMHLACISHTFRREAQREPCSHREDAAFPAGLCVNTLPEEKSKSDAVDARLPQAAAEKGVKCGLVPGYIEMNTPNIPFGEGQMTHAEYMARVLAELLRTALHHLAPLGGLALDYATLPGSVISRIAPHFDLALSTAQIDAMNARIPFHAKQPYFAFEPDSQRKQQEATDEARAQSAKHLDPLYAQLQQR